MPYTVPTLPLDYDFETKELLKKTASAGRALAEMKGTATSVDNESILIDTISLQEAKDSSAIENIITTYADLYRSDAMAENFRTMASKEVYAYGRALRHGFDIVKQNGFISGGHIKEIQEMITGNNAGYRRLPGTELKNEQTGETVYTPPQTHDEVVKLMGNLEQFMNDDTLSGVDPLIKMGVIHHQFESIHPFYDGNGRTGRIINILYLVKEGILSLPILYLSRYINRNKAEYYKLLQKVRTGNAWDEWILFILDGVEQTSLSTIGQITGIKELMLKHKNKMRDELPKIYSQDLLNNIFRHPYTKIDFVIADLDVSRVTATRYLDELCGINILNKMRAGRDSYYINTDLYNLLANSAEPVSGN